MKILTSKITTYPRKNNYVVLSLKIENEKGSKTVYKRLKNNIKEY